MNKDQRIAIIIGFGLIILSCLFPPYEGRLRSGKVSHLGRYFLFLPPTQKDVKDLNYDGTTAILYRAGIVFPELVLQLLVIALTSGGVTLLLAKRKLVPLEMGATSSSKAPPDPPEQILVSSSKEVQSQQKGREQSYCNLASKVVNEEIKKENHNSALESKITNDGTLPKTETKNQKNIKINSFANAENFIFVTAIITSIIRYGYPDDFSSYSIVRSLGYCSVLIPFALAFNILRKDSFTKSIMGWVLIISSSILLSLFFFQIWDGCLKPKDKPAKIYHYKIGEEKYAIPAKKLNGFLNLAKEKGVIPILVIPYKVDGSTYYVPEPKVNEFLLEVGKTGKTASLLDDPLQDEGIKEKDNNIGPSQDVNNNQSPKVESPSANKYFFSKDGNFKINFPVEPTSNTVQHPLQKTIMFHSFTCEKDNHLYGVVYNDYPSGQKDILNDSLKGYLLDSGAEVMSQKEIMCQSQKGLEIKYRINSQNGVLFGVRRFLLIGNRMFTYYCLGLRNKNTNRMDEFVNSFEYVGDITAENTALCENEEEKQAENRKTDIEIREEKKKDDAEDRNILTEDKQISLGRMNKQDKRMEEKDAIAKEDYANKKAYDDAQILDAKGFYVFWDGVKNNPADQEGNTKIYNLYSDKRITGYEHNPNDGSIILFRPDGTQSFLDPRTLDYARRIRKLAKAQVELDKRKEADRTIENKKNQAEQGNAKAQYNLGLCYAKGVGVEKDLKEAVKWYSKAAEQGNVDAQYNLGLCYQWGAGVDENYVEAYKWILIAGADEQSVRAYPINQTKDIIAKKITKKQIAEAQKKAREFIEKKKAMLNSIWDGKESP